MNCLELKALPRGLRCELCGEPIAAGERCYELPDGLLICAESDCLEEWAEAYRRTAPEEGETEA